MRIQGDWNKGYISPIFLLITGVFLTVLLATLIVNFRSVDFSPQAVEEVKNLPLLPGEKGEVNCGNGSEVNIVSQENGNLKVECSGIR